MAASPRNGSTRYAVIDVGSNTVHLLVADSNGRALTAIDDESTRLRLGAEVAHSGALDRGKIRLAVQTVRGYVTRGQQLRCKTICLVGTQAVRSASNGEELASAVQTSTDLPLHVIDPAFEARLGYLGTTLDVPDQRARLVIDMGGGSTQLTLADASGEAHFVQSLPIGSVALPARFLRHDPPRKLERESMELAVHQAVGVLNVHPNPAHRIVRPEYGVVVGGVGRRLSRAGRLEPPEPLVRLWIERLADAAMTVSAEAMDVFGAARFEDADMVRAGAIILREVMASYGLQYCVVSNYGIREGAVLALARGEAGELGD
ncbi:MAG: hypothetical protein JO247_12575 [Chloroflexi bacterium]|nr:hypothetical protein [Chloroflexota bacterium]